MGVGQPIVNIAACKFYHTKRLTAESWQNTTVTDAVQPIAFFDNTFEEALILAREARDYLAYQEHSDYARLSAVARLGASCEAMRLTARISQIIAWLLIQKAVHAGELSRSEAAKPEHRLAGHRVCEETNPVVEDELPQRLMELLDRSYQLYLRVSRLDAMMDRETP